MLSPVRYWTLIRQRPYSRCSFSSRDTPRNLPCESLRRQSMPVCRLKLLRVSSSSSLELCSGNSPSPDEGLIPSREEKGAVSFIIVTIGAPIISSTPILPARVSLLIASVLSAGYYVFPLSVPRYTCRKQSLATRSIEAFRYDLRIQCRSRCCIGRVRSVAYLLRT